MNQRPSSSCSSSLPSTRSSPLSTTMASALAVAALGVVGTVFARSREEAEARQAVWTPRPASSPAWSRSRGGAGSEGPTGCDGLDTGLLLAGELRCSRPTAEPAPALRGYAVSPEALRLEAVPFLPSMVLSRSRGNRRRTFRSAAHGNQGRGRFVGRPCLLDRTQGLGPPYCSQRAVLWSQHLNCPSH